MQENNILFICIGNAGRSQMAEAFALNQGLTASSAGTNPSTKMSLDVIHVIKEKGIDISSNTPKKLTTKMIEKADLVVTMGCSVEEGCPEPILSQIQKKQIKWHLEDPKNKPIEQIRKIRDQIEQKVLKLSNKDSRM